MNYKPYLLHVDDYIKNIIIVQKMLEEYFDVNFVNSGQNCLDSIAQQTPDLILLGESLPLFDEDETIQLIQANARYKDIPIILLSAAILANEPDIDCKTKYVLHEKPFDKNKLVSSIKQLLDQTEKIVN